MHEIHCHDQSEEPKSAEITAEAPQKPSRPKNSFVSKMNFVLFWVFALVFIANVAVLGFFTVTVNGKLNAALELTAPQKGTLTEIRPEACELCGTMEDFKKQIGTLNVEFASEQVYTAESPEGKQFIQQYSITKLPALVFKAEKSLKPAFKKAVETGAVSPSDTVLVWEKPNPPYFDIEKGAAAGLVTVKFLTKKSCAQCYDPVVVHTSLLGRLGVAFGSTETLDADDEVGKALIEQYSLTKIPAVILSNDAALYDRLTGVWSQVGTVESDGMYIFRSAEVLGVPYYDLEKGEMITPEKE